MKQTLLSLLFVSILLCPSLRGAGQSVPLQIPHQKTTSRPANKHSTSMPFGIEPLARDCRYDRVVSHEVITVVCQGTSKSYKGAMRNAKFGACRWVAMQSMFSSTAKKQFTKHRVLFYRNCLTWVPRCQTDGTVMQTEDGYLHINAFCSVNRYQLETFLTRHKIPNIQTEKKTILRLVLGSQSMDDRWNQFLIQTAQDYFVARGFHTISDENVNAQARDKATRIGKRQQPSSPAEVRIKLQVIVTQRGGNVQAIATFYAYAIKDSRILQSSNAWGRIFPYSVPMSEYKTTKEAIHNAQERLVLAVLRYGRKKTTK